MIEMRIESKPAFAIVGRKTWISGQDNAAFGCFWQQCHQEGLFDSIVALGGARPGPVTQGMALGVSCVEADPTVRRFYFYVGLELAGHISPHALTTKGLERYEVPASTWAIFRSQGPMPDALVALEIYAFTQWLPKSGHVHANAPELEVYPPGRAPEGETLAEFWLPVRER